MKHDNILKLKLLCPGGMAASISAAGILQPGCHMTQKKWMTLGQCLSTYKRVTTVYSTKTLTLCKCGRPGNDRAIGYTFKNAEALKSTGAGATG